MKQDVSIQAASIKKERRSIREDESQDQCSADDQYAGSFNLILVRCLLKSAGFLLADTSVRDNHGRLCYSRIYHLP